MEERSELIGHLERYSDEQAMGFDVGYHLRLLVQALKDEETEELEG